MLQLLNPSLRGISFKAINWPLFIKENLASPMEKLISLLRRGYTIELRPAFGYNMSSIMVSKIHKSVKFTQTQVLPNDNHLDRIPEVLGFIDLRLEEEIEAYFKPKNDGKKPTL